jgi:hypothetical protein
MAFDPRDPTINWPSVPDTNRGFQYPGSGLNNAAEYVASGLPFVTTSTGLGTTPTEINFPYVTKCFQIHAVGGNLRLGFTENGINGTNYFVLHQNDGAYHFDIRCKTLYVRADSSTVTMSLCAAMTQIDSKQFPVLSGAYADDQGRAAFISSSVGQKIFGFDGLG